MTLHQIYVNFWGIYTICLRTYQYDPRGLHFWMAMAYPGVLDCLEPPTHTKKKKGEQKEEEINGYKLHQIWFHPETTQPLSK